MASPRGTTFRFGSRRVSVPPSRSLLSALMGSHLPILQRSIRYHRPRAPFCGVGQCTNCLIRVNGIPNVRACRYVPSDGDFVETENSWPSPAVDLLSALDVLLPGGIDTLRGFRRPAWATPLYHRVVRRLSGYGRLADPGQGSPPPVGSRHDTDVAVIGLGVAGAAALRTLQEHGANALGIERGSVEPLPGTPVLPGTAAAFLPPPVPGPAHPWRIVCVERGSRGVQVRARAVVVATGGYDAGLWFSGSDRPGVMTAEGALSMTGNGGRGAFRKAVVFGGGPRAADLLDRWGALIEAVVAPGAVSPEVSEKASALEVPLYPRTLLLAARGRRRVRAALLRSRAEGTEFAVEADAIILAHRRLPHPQLYFQAGAKMEWRHSAAAYFPTLREGTETSLPGLFASGEGAGFLGPTAVEASGVAAARQAMGMPAPAMDEGSRVDATAPNEIEGYYRELLTGRRVGGKWVICPCEDVLLSEVEEAHALGYRGIEVLKRYTGVGSGLCQGRYCLPDTLLLLARLEQRPAPEVGYITQRPPVTPWSLSAFATLPEDGEPEGPG
ncbi:MAG: 2Fe-2S iron-sulfur cluster-binding protein [Thermoplasmata archaeon]|nr:2Fe-2S iron-sulfur cluster-binding protein [Thermoplasmata archaeon]